MLLDRQPLESDSASEHRRDLSMQKVEGGCCHLIATEIKKIPVILKKCHAI